MVNIPLASHYIFTVFQESQKPLLIRLSLKIGYPNNLMIHHPFPRKKTCHLMGILIFRLAPNPCLTDAEIPMFDCWTDLNMSIFMMKSYKIMVFHRFSMVFHGFSWRHPPLISPPTSGFPPVTKVRVLCLKRPTSWPKQRWWLESLINSISIYTHISTHICIYTVYIYICIIYLHVILYILLGIVLDMIVYIILYVIFYIVLEMIVYIILYYIVLYYCILYYISYNIL